MQAGNPLLDAFYALNRAATLDQGREAASQIHAPGLNVLWANAKGDIAWWAAAQLPQRPPGVNPLFILDAAKGEAEKPGFYNFTFNPQEENPPRGYIVSANSQPSSSIPMPGYYHIPDRYIELDRQLADPQRRWTVDDAKALQLDACNGYPKRLLHELLPVMEQVLTDPNERAFMEPLQKWDGCYSYNSVAATLFSELSYQLARAAFADELGEERFNTLLQTHAIDFALPLLAADPNSPWWDNINTPQVENRYETVRVAWAATVAHLMDLYGTSLIDWTWENTHTLTFVHPMGRQKPFNRLFNTGPFFVPGGRETPNNFSGPVATAPWAVQYGPSTRRVIDFAKPEKAWGISPLGQSGVLFDRHYADQAQRFVEGGYVRERLSEEDVRAHTESTLTLQPGSP
jgi:penicillin amidase